MYFEAPDRALQARATVNRRRSWPAGLEPRPARRRPAAPVERVRIASTASKARLVAGALGILTRRQSEAFVLRVTRRFSFAVIGALLGVGKVRAWRLFRRAQLVLEAARRRAN